MHSPIQFISCHQGHFYRKSVMYYKPKHVTFKYYLHHHQHLESVLPKGRSFTANSGTKAAVLSKGRSSTANSGTNVALLLGIKSFDSFPFLSASHSLFSIWTDLTMPEKFPGASTWGWGDWIWLTGPSVLHRNSPWGLNISSIRVFWPEQSSGNPNHPSPAHSNIMLLIPVIHWPHF